MNKKGFTVIELLVSFTLTAVIVIFLFQIVFSLRNIFVSSGLKTKLITKESIMNSNINDDFVFKNLSLATKINNSQIRFYFKDGTVKDLIIDDANKMIKYGSNTYELVSGSKLGNISITTNSFTKTSGIYNGILTIKIPIYHALYENEDFGINIIYLYDTSSVSLAGLNLVNVVDNEKQIFLNSENTISFVGVNFVDPGYYVLDTTTSTVTQNDPSVVVSGAVDSSRKGNYYITYTLYDMNHNIMDQKVRTVNVVDSEYNFSYTGTVQEFVSPVKGTYKIELWGASGGGNGAMAGKGGYTVGNYVLNKDDVLYLNVGGKGTLGTSGVAGRGGYNGGGDSGVSTTNFAGGGGGATDIRIASNTLDARVMVAGGGGGAGSRNDSSYTCNGGSGGGLSGTMGKCSSDTYLGGAGTQTSGGAKASYTTKMTTLPTAGISLLGGIGGTYTDGDTTYASGGGGGGLYGGGGGARYAGGGGGSGLCLDSICETYTGEENFRSISGAYEMGHYGDGHIRISLLSID